MADYKSWIIQNNRLTAPLLAILFSALVVLLAINLFGELMFLVPVVTFFTFHYTKFYRFKLRLLASVIVFLVVAFLATGLLTSALYNAHPTYKTEFYLGTNETGTNVTASVSPYSGSSQYYSFQIYVTPNGTFDFNTLYLNVHSSEGSSVSVPFSQLHKTNFSNNNTMELTYQLSNIKSGIYTYNLTAQHNGSTIYTPEISGPINTSQFIVYTYLLPTYAIYYVIIFELIFVAGLFIGRSFSNVRRSTPPPPPEKPEKGN